MKKLVRRIIGRKTVIIEEFNCNQYSLNQIEVFITKLSRNGYKILSIQITRKAVYVWSQYYVTGIKWLDF